MTDVLHALHHERLLPEQMLSDLPAFIEKIKQLAQDLKLDITQLQADHVALRINDEALAHAAHQAWLEHGQMLSTAQINGRPIVVLKFTHPIEIGAWQIACLELPYPAKGKLYPRQGWEHIEFVIPAPFVSASASDYLSVLQHQNPNFANALEQAESRGISIKLSSPKGEGERLANPTVAFKRQGVCIKLHPHSLLDIVASEQADTRPT
ncbi:VOC family protein [Vibrio sp. SM6]|uniref:VOC family protein n=1 Tax=Vibrio agarilyticus TaxID=2726741 RepID=A0A7X8TN08_9VIBR|nr:VOC family protein [Vibrio agarilyticus]NLS11565.1 VOC family protein [Vibrio agarilyticus]